MHAEENTWSEFYELFEIGYASSEICVKGIAVDMLDATRQTGHGRLSIFFLSR